MSTQVPDRFVEKLNVRNLLDNGGFEIWQRGAGPFTGAGNPFADRWKLQNGGGPTLSIARANATTTLPMGTYNMEATVTGATGSGNAYVYQYVEDYKSYRGRTVSLSMRVYTSIANKVRLWLSDGITVTLSDYHTGSGAWETLTVTMTMSDSLGAVQATVGMYPNDDANGVFYVDNAMLVAGSEPVAFVPTPPAEEWDRCQRHYETGYFNGYVTVVREPGLNRIRETMPLKSQKLSTPTGTFVKTAVQQQQNPGHGSGIVTDTANWSFSVNTNTTGDGYILGSRADQTTYVCALLVGRWYMETT